MTAPKLEAPRFVRLLSDMEALRRFLRLYPTGHPALGPARERLSASLKEIGHSEETVIALGPDHFYVGSERIHLAAGQPARQIVRLLFDLGFGAVCLKGEVAAESLFGLIEVLSELREPVSQGDRERILHACSRFPGIELVPLDLSAVQGVPDGTTGADPGTRLVWGELVRRLGRDGAFALEGGVIQGDLTPGSVAASAATSGNPETLFDFLFAELARELEDQPQPRRPLLLREIRLFLAEVLSLLEPEHRALALSVGVRRLPLIEVDDDPQSDSLIGAETVLDAVEVLMRRERDVPELLQRAIYRMAAPAAAQRPQVPDEVIIRARRLLPRLPLATAAGQAHSTTLDEAEALLQWNRTAWAGELRQQLEEKAVRSHLVRILGEALALTSDGEAARQLAARLGEEFVTSLDLGDLATAARLAPMVASSRGGRATESSLAAAVAAAVRGYSLLDRIHHPVLTAVLTSLGTRGLPFVLEQLASVESLAVRKRLLEVAIRQGDAGLPIIRRLLQDSRWFVVRNAVFLLRRLGDRQTLPLVRSLLPGAHPQVVSEILKALIAAGDPDWFSLLMAEIDAADPQRRSAAISVSARVRHPEVVKALVTRLESIGPFRFREPVATELIEALGQLRDPAALGVLRSIASGRGWRRLLVPRTVRAGAARAIARLEGAGQQRLGRRLATRADTAVAQAVPTAMERVELHEEDL